MKFRKFFCIWPNEGETDVPPRSKSQLGSASSQSTPPTLQRRKSGGKRSRSSTKSHPCLQFGLGTTGGATSQTSPVPDHHPPTPDTDADVPPCSKSQLGLRSSQSTPPTLQRRKSDGKRSRSSTKLGATGGATSQTSPVSGHHPPAPDADENKPVKLSSYTVDPTAAYKPDWKSTLHASAGLVLDVLKESSDAFTPLKSVAGGLSAILKHYDVR